jgi:hypothetical protein
VSLLDQAREAEVYTSGIVAHPDAGKVSLPVEARDALVELADAYADWRESMYGVGAGHHPGASKSQANAASDRMSAALERLRR